MPGRMTLTETITFQIEKMGKESTVIILGTAHLATTPGKCSPDGQFREYAYSREIVAAVAAALSVSVMLVAPGVMSAAFP